MRQKGKTVWHKVGALKANPEAELASERAFRANADGTIHGGVLWTRGARTCGTWRRMTLKDEFRTVAALEAFLTANGWTRGRAPLGTKAPSIETVQRWSWDGAMEATDGCHVEDDGTCPHGCRSWLLVYGLI